MASSKNDLNAHLQSIEWLKDLFDHAHDLIQIVALDGTMLYVNKTWSILLGYEQGQIIGKPLLSFIDKEDRQRYTAYRQQVVAGTISNKPIVVNLETNDGKQIAVEGVVSVKIENGIPLYTRGIFRNITERVENEKRLQALYDTLAEREYNFQQLLTYAPDAVIVIDPGSIIRYWNPKAEEIFGWAAGEVLGKPLASTIIPPQYRQAHEAGMKRYLSTGEIHVLNKTIEITALKRTGEEFYISLTISRASQHSGVAFVAFVRDINQQKQALRELENKTKQLENSNKSLEAFAYATSHDLKQPIRKMQIFSGRLLTSANSKLDASEKDYLHRIQNASVRMQSLIDDLMNYSSLNSNKDLDAGVDLNELLSDVTASLEMEIKEKNVNIHLDALPVVKGSKRQLQQLFQNLLENSIKYSKSSATNNIHVYSKKIKGIESPFELPAIEAGTSFHLIEVKDEGIGFDQQHAEKIFNMFIRLHTQQQYEGTGVGLSIALKAVENHHGYIKAWGEKGVGATFIILLPV